MQRRRLELKGGNVRNRTSRKVSQRRRGSVIVEGLWVMMIMLFVSIAFVVWAILVMGAQAVDAGAAEGARVAARGGYASSASRQAATEAAVVAVLAAHGMSSSDIQVSLDETDPTYVEVTVAISLSAAGVPDWLSFMNFSLGSREFQVSALARRA